MKMSLMPWKTRKEIDTQARTSLMTRVSPRWVRISITAPLSEVASPAKVFKGAGRSKWASSTTSAKLILHSTGSDAG